MLTLSPSKGGPIITVGANQVEGARNWESFCLMLVVDVIRNGTMEPCFKTIAININSNKKA